MGSECVVCMCVCMCNGPDAHSLILEQDVQEGIAFIYISDIQICRHAYIRTYIV